LTGEGRKRGHRIVSWGIVTWVLTGAAAAPPGLAAQLAPDTPRLISPHGSGGFAAHWVRAGTLPGDEEAVLVTWAMPGLPDGVRLRAGLGTGAGGSTAGSGGIDVQAPLLRGGSDRPFDLDWQGGIGVGVGDYLLITVPFGLTGGVSWTSGAVWLAPYVSAGLAADLRLGDDAPTKEFQVDPTLDVGFDLSLDPERRFVLRAAAALGARQALSLGLAVGVGR
jgi:hypothetical protein